MPIDGPNQKFSFAQLESLWVQAGGSKKLAPTMAAIALAESGGNSGNHNPNAATGDDSYGLWQINYYGANRAPRTARWGPPQSMYNPVNNARAAVDLAGSNGSGLHNWSTYNSSAYLKYIAASQAGVGSGFIHTVGGWLYQISPVSVIQGKNTTIKPAVDTLTNIPGTLKKLVYGLAIGGGGLLFLLSVALIGADIGISRFKGGPTNRVKAVLPARTKRATADQSAAKEAAGARAEERREARERRAQEHHEVRLKTEKARATELRTRTRHRRRNKQQQEEEVKRAYIHGARDAKP